MDAYTDSGPTAPPVRDDRPVTKKNKNKRKREQQKQRQEEERQRQLQESNKTSQEAEVIESWEDLDATMDTTSVPRTIELPPTPIIEPEAAKPEPTVVKLPNSKSLYTNERFKRPMRMKLKYGRSTHRVY